MNEESYDAALDLLRRLNPKSVKTHLNNIIRLQPNLAEELLSSVDVPLGIAKDPSNGKQFLTCDYNRDLDSYRSPWSNKYYPELDDEDESPFPSDDLRILEQELNNSFDIYRDLYYEAGFSSVYLWDSEEGENFAGVVLLKKQNDQESSWDSIHVLEVELKGHFTALYKVTSTVILDLSSVQLDLSGNLIRQTSRELPLDNQSDKHTAHIVNIGTLVEEIESKLRNLLQEVYFGKTKDVIGDIRSLTSLKDVELDKQRQQGIAKSIQGL